MHQIIASYLFQFKTCPLPGLGTLYIHSGKATADFLNKIFNAPVPAVIFENKDTDASNLLDYIVGKTNCTVNQAIENLSRFCNNLKKATLSNLPATLDAVGNFFTDDNGNIKFKPTELPVAFRQPVNAERVIHPKAEHAMLVGDKETTNTVMTEYFNEIPLKKDRWWIWAIVLGVIAFLVIMIYYSITNLSSMAGNSMPIN